MLRASLHHTLLPKKYTIKIKKPFIENDQIAKVAKGVSSPLEGAHLKPFLTCQLDMWA